MTSIGWLPSGGRRADRCLAPLPLLTITALNGGILCVRLSRSTVRKIPPLNEFPNSWLDFYGNNVTNLARRRGIALRHLTPMDPEIAAVIPLLDCTSHAMKSNRSANKSKAGKPGATYRWLKGAVAEMHAIRRGERAPLRGWEVTPDGKGGFIRRSLDPCTLAPPRK